MADDDNGGAITITAGGNARSSGRGRRRGYRVRTGTNAGSKALIDDGLQRHRMQGGVRLGFAVDPIEHRSRARGDTGWQTQEQKGLELGSGGAGGVYANKQEGGPGHRHFAGLCAR
jgi:hypothetical protein